MDSSSNRIGCPSSSVARALPGKQTLPPPGVGVVDAFALTEGEIEGEVDAGVPPPPPMLAVLLAEAVGLTETLIETLTEALGDAVAT